MTTAAIFRFPERSIRAWAECEASLRDLVREGRRSGGFADELVVRIKPMFELLFSFRVMTATGLELEVNAALHRLMSDLLAERAYAEIVTLKELGYR